MTTAARIVDRPDQTEKRLKGSGPVLFRTEQQANQVANV
jgi:hypothetical protein